MQGLEGQVLAHVDMDAFYAAVERLDQPRLAGAPIIVGGGKRGVVSAASYEARRFGVRSAMPMFEARSRCPQGVFLTPRMERYRQVSRRVMEVLAGFSPLLEPVSVDEAYLDLTGTERLWGPPAQAGMAIKRAMHQATGLTCSVGIAPVRFLAKIASDRDKPDGLTVVTDLEAFLATVSLKEVPGVGARGGGRPGGRGVRGGAEGAPRGAAGRGGGGWASAPARGGGAGGAPARALGGRGWGGPAPGRGWGRWASPAWWSSGSWGRSGWSG
ncbi:MAG: DNA polymerase IV [Desulfarculus sp.]|nr:DNA polymerase IV [Desulfarculus sp.]